MAPSTVIFQWQVCDDLRVLRLGKIYDQDRVLFEAHPPRIIDRVVVGDGPEGLAISPKGDVAAAVILAGSNNKNAYFHKRNGSISVLGIDGKKVSRVGDLAVGGLPEGAVFTPDGKYLLVGNYLDQDISILKVDGTKITDTGKRFKVPGHPASMRIDSQ